MDIILEVGQVWKSIKTEKEWTVIDLFDVESVPYVAHKLMLDGVVVNVAFCTQSNFVNGVTLITTADGKPYVKPNDYKAGDVWEDLRDNDLISFMKGSGGLLECRYVFFVFWEHHENVRHVPDLEVSQNFRLVFRDGKVITND